ncbi:type III-A CRISPR-associated protein Csm2 [Paucidesulfovibrio longus]|uniref:type III-A CRISPR-associated protein Csm2 n=1 Tax=Paucidesulfovibrio longus TaxID=889 RepID=UPI0003B79FC9|nr:type III-A CRISPR-associated protein Csm2 [Paucidesulfovibrio longus]
MSIYFDDQGNIRKELLGEESENVAQTFVVLKDNKLVARESVNSAQLRRFYGELKSLEKKLEFKRQGGSNSDAFLSILPLVKMVKSKVAYASNPKNQKVPMAFANWLKKNIDAIETAEDFEAFMLHFEAVVGFCYGRGISNS